jgi:peptide/nickel transport system substrate-binding protein
MRANRLSAACVIALIVALATPAAAQKSGGTLRLYHNDNPPSASLLEESTIASVTPFSAVFNNLVRFDPSKVHESIDTVIPDLAESWSWDDTNTKLTFKLRQGVKWHDGQPFTAKDVQCTWRMLIGKSEAQDFHRNPRKVWYSKLNDVSINGDYEATFELSEPQPSLPVLLASAFSAVYPCHVPQAIMRTRPVGTGPFKFVEFKRGTSIRLVRNPDYWKKDRPYLDEITFRMVDSRATRLLGFVTGEFDITFPSDVSVPLMKDIKAQAPNAICEMVPTGTQINLMVNRANPPFDNPEIRHAMSLALDRKPYNTILMEGLALTGGAMLPKPVGEWGMPPDMVAQLAGYGADTAKNIAQAQAIMQKLGYSDTKPLAIKIQTRNLPTYREPAVILADQLKKIYINGELDILETPQWYAAGAEGLHHRAECDRRQRRRSRRQPGRELQLQIGAQLYPVLQRRGGPAAVSAIARARQGQAPANRLGDRAPAGRRRRASDHPLQRRRQLLAALCQGLHPARQQPVQQPAVRGCMAG